MPITAIPNEMVLAIADILPTCHLSLLSRTNTALNSLLTPVLYRRATQHDLDHCIIRDRPDSLRALLRPPTTLLSIENNLLAVTPIRPLHYAALNCSPALVSTIIDLGAPVDDPTPTPTRTTTLQLAVWGGNTTTARIILNAGADINRASSITRHTPLVLACTLKDSAMAHLLIDYGARLPPGVLVHATLGGVVTVMQRLLDLGVPVNATHDCISVGRPVTALQGVCLMCNRVAIEPVEVLLRAGADPNVDAGGAMAPLYWCVIHNDVELARVLMKWGADPYMVFEGRTMLELAELCENWEVLALLKGGR